MSTLGPELTGDLSYVERTGDDAVHVIDDMGRQTLCGQPLAAGMNLTRLYGPQPDGAAGCWTCMKNRAELVGDLTTPEEGTR